MLRWTENPDAEAAKPWNDWTKWADALHSNYVGEGYGIPTAGTIEAIRMLAELEGILLDPVYSGKCFDGLINLINKKYFNNSDSILFLHTGGSASLSAYEWAFQK